MNVFVPLFQQKLLRWIPLVLMAISVVAALFLFFMVLKSVRSAINTAFMSSVYEEAQRGLPVLNTHALDRLEPRLDPLTRRQWEERVQEAMVPPPTTPGAESR